jgi:transposase InsO family protein
MLLHGNARLSPFQRTLVCERVRLEGWTVEEAADAAGCSQRTVYRWLARHDAGDSMLDRSSAPHRRPTRTPRRVEAQIERLRRLRWTSTKIAATLNMAVSTVCATTTIGFVERAIGWFAERGVKVRQVMSDNGVAYKSAPFATWCAQHRIEHIRTRPYRPQTNGKAERFIQTMLREWADVRGMIR